MFINHKKLSAVKTAFLRNLVVALALFNFAVFFYIAIKSTSDPVVESNFIEGMVVYHFLGSFLVGTGMVVATLDLNDKDE